MVHNDKNGTLSSLLNPCQPHTPSLLQHRAQSSSPSGPLLTAASPKHPITVLLYQRLAVTGSKGKSKTVKLVTRNHQLPMTSATFLHPLILSFSRRFCLIFILSLLGKFSIFYVSNETHCHIQ